MAGGTHPETAAGMSAEAIAAKQIPPPPAPPFREGRCTFILQSKGRRCRCQAMPGLDRCGVHREDADAAAADERIPCPLDPGHTVYAKRLSQHLKVCTKVRDADVVTQQPFYKRGVNSGLASNTAAAEDAAPAINASPPEVMQAWIDRIRLAYPQAVREVLGASADANALLELSVVAEAVDRGHAEKHEVQNQALAQIVSERGLARDAVVVEYGCGRGGLAAAVLGLHPDARCVLLDREPRRHKFENRQESRGRSVLRLRLDIADFDLSAFLRKTLDAESLPKAADFASKALTVTSGAAEGAGFAERLEELWRSVAALQRPSWPPQRVLACAKHLCGGATDVALRSLLGRCGVEASICLATCCHHRCDAGSYVNMPFLSRIGLCTSAEEFAQFVSTAGWGVGGIGSVDSAAGRERRYVGMMAKRILDLGRVAWLQEVLGLADARLSSYIGKDVTPENMAIVAGERAASEEIAVNET